MEESEYNISGSSLKRICYSHTRNKCVLFHVNVCNVFEFYRYKYIVRIWVREIIVTGSRFLKNGFQYSLITGQNTLRTLPFAFLYTI